MATIVFNAIGTALGGPIGGAIGALTGRQFDSVLFGRPGSRGPRLQELAVTASSYGQPLPRHFGRMRVAGSVIWATDLVEHSETRGGGKGSPSLTSYAYTASFAVALASRPIAGIGRIWADGKLLRGEAGDLKAAGTLRIHTGEGDQPPDPLILAAEGADRCPAHRGLAYVVFEDLDLSDFFNRIPSLSFEVMADSDFTLQQVFGEMIEDCDAAVPLQGLAGLSCEGPLGETLAMLGQVMPIEADAGGEQVVIARARLQEDAIPLRQAVVATADDAFGGRAGYIRHRAAPADRHPSALRYFDTGRDYQPGIQHASGRAATGAPATLELPAAIDAATARALIERTARRADWTRDRVSWRTGELDPAVAPGAIVTLPAIAGRWRVAAWEWRETGVELELEHVAPVGADSIPALGADAGRPIPPVDAPLGMTALAAFELPLDAASAGTDRPRPFAAVSSPGAGWRGAALFADLGDGALHALGPSGRLRSVIGTAGEALPPANPLLFDRTSQLPVSLIDPAMQLVSADALQLANGANLALVGEEIVQFAQATPAGEGAWILRSLLRGRGGTEAAIGGHMADEPFVLLDAKPVALDPAVLGSAAGRQVVAIGPGDTDPVAAPVALGGITLRPLAPVHPRRTVLPDGSWRLSWTRCARGGWAWQDGVDVPLVEEAEAYRITFGPAEAPVATWITEEPVLEISAALLGELSDLAPGELFAVRQQGTHALSAPLALSPLP